MFVKEIYKEGRKFYGWWITDTDSGLVIYMARKPHKDIFRNGEPSISEAMRKGTAAWGFDKKTVELARIKGVTFIGIHDPNTGTRYLTSMDRLKFCYDRSFICKDRTTLSRRFLPLQYFKVIHKVKI